MKKAFTIFEIIIVLTLICLLSYIALPKTTRNSSYEAAEQIAFHIRYTQSLAMQDNKMTFNNNAWYKKYWRILFHNGVVKGQEDYGRSWRYTIFSDDNTYSGNPNSLKQIADDPSAIGKKLTSGYAYQSYNKKVINERLNLTKYYGIKKVSFIGCARSQTIAFDNIGRAYTAMQGANSLFDRLLKTKCKIKLKSSTDSTMIIVHPESGFVEIKKI